eukprot:SM000082S22838  [mRNA]  locus=s82:214066:216770:+ [translate_table: standard]
MKTRCCAASMPLVVRQQWPLGARKDGMAGIFDLRTRAMEQRHRNGGSDAVTSVVWQPHNDNTFHFSAATTVYSIDLRQGPGVEPLHKFAFNCEEINQVAISNKGTFLAAADDSGEVKVVDLAEGKLRKALQAAHSNICSSVQFHPRRPWEGRSSHKSLRFPVSLTISPFISRIVRIWNRALRVSHLQCIQLSSTSALAAEATALPVAVVTGGLDCKVVRWDFSRGLPRHSWDFSSEVVRSCEGLGAMCNPPLVHSVAVPLAEVPGRAGKLLAVARGDACVALYDLDFEASRTSTSSGKVRGARKAERHEISETSGSIVAGAESRDEHRNGRLCLLGPKDGGHKAAVSHGLSSAILILTFYSGKATGRDRLSSIVLLTFNFVLVGNRHFANFCSGARHVISGGEDARIKIWRVDEVECLTAGRKPSISIDHTSKVNWLATSSLQHENLLAADVTSSISIYNVL